MNKSQLINLFKVNLLYANPQATVQLRKKGKTGNKIYRSILMQYVLMGIFFTFIYGIIMVAIDFSKYPGFFTFYAALFSVMTFSQGVSILYNVFYDSKDLKDYLPLPFQQKDVFLAKFLIVALTLLPFLLPVFVLFVLTTVRSSLSLLIGLPLSVILFILFFFLCCGISTVLVSGLTQTQIFMKHKNIMTTLMMLIPAIGMAFGIMYINQKQSNIYDGTLSDQAIIYPFLPFHVVLTDLFSVNGFVSLAGILLACGLLIIVLKQWVIPSFYRLALGEESQAVSQKQTKTKPAKKQTYDGLPKQLLRYNINLIKNPTLLMQVLTSTLVMPMILAFPTIFGGLINLSSISNKFWVIAFLAGMFLALFTINSTSIISLIISLDRENLYFVRSLPISMKAYMKVKFKFAYMFQVILTSIVTLALALILHLPLLLVLFAVLGTWYGCFVGGMYYFNRDFRLLSLNWTNVSQLFTRGGGNFAMVFSMFGTLILGSLLIGGSIALIVFVPASLVVSLILFLVILSIGFIMFNHYKQTFWRNL